MRVKNLLINRAHKKKKIYNPGYLWYCYNLDRDTVLIIIIIIIISE